MNPNELQAGLSQFTGTESYYRHLSGLLYTDGVLYLAESAGAHWLIDIVASYQPQCRKDDMLASIQFWTLRVNLSNKTAVVTCERDSNDVVIRQAIEFTDFILAEQKLYVTAGGPEGRWVLMLPSEY